MYKISTGISIVAMLAGTLVTADAQARIDVTDSYAGMCFKYSDQVLNLKDSTFTSRSHALDNAPIRWSESGSSLTYTFVRDGSSWSGRKTTVHGVPAIKMIANTGATIALIKTSC